MVIYTDKQRARAAADGYGKQTVSKEEFEEIVKEEKSLGGLTRKQLLGLYRIK